MMGYRRVYVLFGLKVFRTNDGLDHQRARKLAHGLHAHSVKFSHKLVSTKCVIEKNPHSQALPKSFKEKEAHWLRVRV
eukprot:1146711-Pelagomonas_calceolata.AAC.1